MNAFRSRKRRQATIALVALGMAGLPAALLAAPTAPIPSSGGLIGVEPFPGAIVVTTCIPPAASVTTPKGTFTLPASSTCYSLETTRGARGVLNGDIAAPSLASAPLFVVRRGTIVRFRFSAPPQGVVRLQVQNGPNLRSHASYRLSPFTTTWRARGPGGVLTLSVAFSPATTPGGDSVDNSGLYMARFVVR
jgi:hypothetical protein